MAQMGTTSSGSVRSSAGCRCSAGVYLYSAHTGTIEEPLLHAVSSRKQRVPSTFFVLGDFRNVGLLRKAPKQSNEASDLWRPRVSTVPFSASPC